MFKNLLQRPSIYGIWAVLAALLISGGIVALNTNSMVSAAQQGTTITLISPDQAFVGELIRVKLVVSNAQNLAGYQGGVRYAANGLRLTGVISEKGLSLSGRDTLPLESIWREGVVILGAATCPVSDCSETQYASTPRYTQGVNGDVELATLEFIAEAPGIFELTLQDVQLADPQGNQLGAVPLDSILDVSSK